MSRVLFLAWWAAATAITALAVSAAVSMLLGRVLRRQSEALIPPAIPGTTGVATTEPSLDGCWTGCGALNRRACCERGRHIQDRLIARAAIQLVNAEPDEMPINSRDLHPDAILGMYRFLRVWATEQMHPANHDTAAWVMLGVRSWPETEHIARYNDEERWRRCLDLAATIRLATGMQSA